MQQAFGHARHSRPRILYHPGLTRSGIIHQHGLRLTGFFEAWRAVSSSNITSRLPSRLQAGTIASEATQHEDLTFSEALKKSIAQSLRRSRQSAEADAPALEQPAGGSAQYGKWQRLSLDEHKLLHETGFSISNEQSVRLIDDPQNSNDLELWACLFDFAHRRMGRNGVLMMWEALYKRRSLHQVDGLLACNFWNTILAAALSSNAILRDVLDYAEWMLETHNARWPQLYSVIMSHMLENGHKTEIVGWHMALAPSFCPDEAEFVDLMKRFIINPQMSGKLQALYTCSPHRKLYDILIPLLFSRGHAQLARSWRQRLLLLDDTPTSFSSRPFLRFLGAYYPLLPLTDDELAAAGLIHSKDEKAQSGDESPGMPINGQNLSYLINRVHGETFGIQEKPYNDRLGARWFASSWVTIDFAINVIYTMGVQEIGPLSLQSIALREGSAPGVLARLDQLRELKINLPKSQYVEAIRHYAVAGNDEALRELLHSDIHPDVFDDEIALNELLSGTLRTGGWAKFRLILSTKLAVLSRSTTASSDSVLEACAHHRNGRLALIVLQEMVSRGLDLAPTSSHILSSFILEDLSKHAKDEKSREVVNVHISLSKQLAASRFPPAVEVWQTLLYRLGRERRLLELERLCVFILELYTNYANSERPMWMAHTADVPAILRPESPYPNFQKVPRDLPLRHEKHPLRQIFDRNLQNCIVRWGFMYTRYDHKAENAAAAIVDSANARAELAAGENDGVDADARAPAEYHFARGIRLLAMLRDRGLYVMETALSKQAMLRLADLYRDGGSRSYEWVGGNPTWRQLRRRNRLSLAEAKVLCDEAWGHHEILPSLLELNRHIDLTEKKDSLNSLTKKVEEYRERMLT